MHRMLAAAIGVVVASLVSTVLMAGLTMIQTGTNASSALGLFPVYYLFSTLFALVLGVPAFLLLLRFNALSWWTLTVVGMLVGALAAVVLRLPSDFHAPDLLVTVPVGGVAALGFWLVWRQAS
jgi:ABC-type transport system involved in multi-copper enzyme maturation permease subunit